MTFRDRNNSQIKLFYSIYNSPISHLIYYYTEDEKLFRIQWIVNDGYKDEVGEFVNKKWNFFESQLESYFKGNSKKIAINLYKHDYPCFTKRVLDELSEIPYGKTLSYKMVAEKINTPKAARAVGNACKRNDLPIVIPCHRVVSSNGLGGYMGKVAESMELEIKKKLLEFESYQTTKS